MVLSGCDTQRNGIVGGTCDTMYLFNDEGKDTPPLVEVTQVPPFFFLLSVLLVKFPPRGL